MDKLEKFVAELNIDRFISFLERESDPAQRAIWTRLLIAEAQRYGRPAEIKDLLAGYIVKIAGRIHEQQGRISQLDGLHPMRRDADLLLTSLQAAHRSLCEAMDRRPQADGE